jgi:hypothetical protein
MFRLLSPSIFLAVLLVGMLLYSQPSENLIENPGFEQVSGNRPEGWITSGDVQVVDDEVYSGEKAVRVVATGGSARITSSWFEAAPHARLEVMAWMKASDIVSSGPYHHLRLTISAYAQDQSTRLMHKDLVSTYGSFDWKQVKGSVITPEATRYLRINAQLTDTSGTFWIDDVDVRIVQIVPEVGEDDIDAPVILPQPRSMELSGQSILLEDIEVRGRGLDPRVRSDLESFFQQAGISYRFTSNECYPPEAENLLLIGGSDHPDIHRAFLNLFEDVTWEELGEQGYFISIQPDGDNFTMFLGANNDQGKYYAIQTLKQMIDVNEKSAFSGEIVDFPTVSRRGIIMGVQWFNDQEEVFRRMAELKLNFIWNQGAFLNEKLWFRWREPLTPGELSSIENYIVTANQQFVDVYIAIGPRGEDSNNPTIYSSDEDINLVVAKMEALYGVGVRNFGLAFDDLVNFDQDRLFGEDIHIFDNDIGAAHAYFVSTIYQSMIAKYPDIKLMVVPMVYSRLSNLGDQELAYLSALGDLPAEIELYSSPEYVSDIEVLREETKRTHIVWDNFYASFYENDIAPEYIIPLERPSQFIDENVSGYTFLPLIPIREDKSLISWGTASDYAWSPERYVPETSFNLAAAKYKRLTDQNDAGSSLFTSILSNNPDVLDMSKQYDVFVFYCIFIQSAIKIE